MKLILTAPVENLGVPGDIVEVKAGYGRNFLLPRGMAVVATRGAQKQVEDIKRAQQDREIRDLDHARELKEQLHALQDVTISVRTADNGKLFGSVKNEDVAKAIKAAGGPSLNKHSVVLPKGLVKSTGSYQTEVKLKGDITATVNFKVVSA